MPITSLEDHRTVHIVEIKRALSKISEFVGLLVTYSKGGWINMGGKVLFRWSPGSELIAGTDLPETHGRVKAYPTMDPVIFILTRVLIFVIYLYMARSIKNQSQGIQEYCYIGSDMITRENWTHEKDIFSKEKLKPELMVKIILPVVCFCFDFFFWETETSRSMSSSKSLVVFMLVSFLFLYSFGNSEKFILVFPKKSIVYTHKICHKHFPKSNGAFYSSKYVNNKGSKDNMKQFIPRL